MVRSHRNKAIVTLLDNQIRLEAPEAEINLSRIIGEYSRSRCNAELRILLQDEIMPEIIATQKEELSQNTVEWLESEGLDIDTYVWEDTLNDLACIAYDRRRHCHPFFSERTTKLEFRRMNIVIFRYLKNQTGCSDPVFFDIRIPLGI